MVAARRAGSVRTVFGGQIGRGTGQARVGRIVERGAWWMMCDNEDENGRPRPALQLWCRSSREPGTRRARNTGPVCLSLLCKMPDTNSRVHVPIWSPEGSASFELALAVRSAARSARMHARSGRRSVLGTAKMCLGRHTPRLDRDSALVGGESTVSCQWKHTPGAPMCRVGCAKRKVESGPACWRVGGFGGAREKKKGGARGWEWKWAGWLYVGWELEVGWSITSGQRVLLLRGGLGCTGSGCACAASARLYGARGFG